MGWPAIILSLLCGCLGIRLQKATLVLVGAVVGMPFAWYLSMTPAGLYIGPLLPVLQLGAAYAVLRQRQRVAWLLLVPVGVVAVYLAYAVIWQVT